MPEMTLERILRTLAAVSRAQQRAGLPPEMRRRLEKAEKAGQRALAARLGLALRKVRPRMGSRHWPRMRKVKRSAEQEGTDRPH